MMNNLVLLLTLVLAANAAEPQCNNNPDDKTSTCPDTVAMLQAGVKVHSLLHEDVATEAAEEEEEEAEKASEEEEGGTDGAAPRYMRILPTPLQNFRWLKEIEVFAKGVTPSAALCDRHTCSLSNNSVDLNASSVIEALGRSWGSPDRLLDGSTAAAWTMHRTRINGELRCEITIDLGPSPVEVGLVRFTGMADIKVEMYKSRSSSGILSEMRAQGTATKNFEYMWRGRPRQGRRNNADATMVVSAAQDPGEVPTEPPTNAPVPTEPPTQAPVPTEPPATQAPVPTEPPTLAPYSGLVSNVAAIEAWFADPWLAWWADNNPRDGRIGGPEVHPTVNVRAITAEIEKLVRPSGPKARTSHHGRVPTVIFEGNMRRVETLILGGIVRAVEAYQWTPMVKNLHNSTNDETVEFQFGQANAETPLASKLNFDGDAVPPPYELVKKLFQHDAPSVNFTNHAVVEHDPKGCGLLTKYYPGQDSGECARCDRGRLCDRWISEKDEHDAIGGDYNPPKSSGPIRLCFSGRCSTAPDSWEDLATKNWKKIEDNKLRRGPLWLTTACAGGPKYYINYGWSRHPSTLDLHSVTQSMFIIPPKAMYVLNLGPGDDVLRASIPFDRYQRGDDPYFAFLGDGNDIFMNAEGIAHVWGGAGDDTMTNTYWAGTTFDGGPGDDYLFCGTTFRGKSKNMICIGGTGNDRIDGSGGAGNTFGFSAELRFPYSAFNWSNSQVSALDTSGPENDGGTDAHPAMHFLYGGQGDDWLTGGSTTFADLGSGDDKYDAPATSVVLGGDGDDHMQCGGRHSSLCFLAGGPGNDKLYVSGGDQAVVFGGPGNDELIGSQNADLLAGGDGHDIIWPRWSTAGSDVILLEPGQDNVDKVMLEGRTWWYQNNMHRGFTQPKLKFDVSKFGFKDFQEVQRAGFSSRVVTDKLVEFRLDVAGKGHVVVQLHTPQGGNWGFKASHFSHENFVYAEAPAVMLETDVDITTAIHGQTCR